jgi:hypothetical protein
MKFRSLNITLQFIIYCFLILSCKKEEVVEDKGIIAGAGYDIVNLTINGKKYDESKVINLDNGSDNEYMCDNKKGKRVSIGYPKPDSRFSVSLSLLHQRLNQDFKQSKIGNYTASGDLNYIDNQINETGPCNLHLYIKLDDNKIRLDFQAGSHAVPKITLVNTSSLYTDYLIEGVFTSSFINRNTNEYITMIGNYKKVIKVFNQ